MRNFFAFSFLFACQICSAQNLVPNGDFETHSSCPDFLSEIFLATPWTGTFVGIPDYYNPCSTSPVARVPNNNWGYQPAHSGNAYSGIYLYDTSYSVPHSYIQSILSDSLNPGNCYHFEMYVNLGNYFQFSCSNIQVYFSDTMVRDFTNPRFLSRPYQIEYTGANFDTITWSLVSGDYTATGGENFIVIGNFKSDSATNPSFVTYPPQSSYQPNAYVYIDDVSLTPTSCATGLNETDPDASVNIYPNPFTNQLSLEVSNTEEVTVHLSDMLGRQVLLATFSSSATISTASLVRGVYFYSLENDKGIIKKGKLVKE